MNRFCNVNLLLECTIEGDEKICLCNKGLSIFSKATNTCYARVGTPCDYKPTSYQRNGYPSFLLTPPPCINNTDCEAIVDRATLTAEESLRKTAISVEMDNFGMRHAMIDYIQKYTAKICICKVEYFNAGTKICKNSRNPGSAGSPQHSTSHSLVMVSVFNFIINYYTTLYSTRV